MNLTQLEVLVALADTGSFTKAAEQIGVTRSAASHALANLEAELGVTLFDRERGGVLPTTIGNCILQNAREILAHVENIRQEAAAARGLDMGKLRIGIVSSIAPGIWGGILRKFRQEYPGIDTVTFEGAGHEVENWILGSIVDVGFVLRPRDGIDSIMIGQDEVRVIVPAAHPLHTQRTVAMRRLAREAFIMPKIACDFHDSSWHGAAYAELQKRYEATEVETVLAMAREELGFTLLPEMLLPKSMSGLHVLSLDPPLHFNFGVAVRSLRNASPAARTFMLSAQIWAAANGYEADPTLNEMFTPSRRTTDTSAQTDRSAIPA
jgi:DNA-binding transcriptional LysR family regulator